MVAAGLSTAVSISIYPWHNWLDPRKLLIYNKTYIAGLRDQTWLCVYCCAWSPGAPRQHPWEFDTTIMFDLDYDMMPPFSPTAAHILLIKSNLMSESRANTASVVMSPRYLGGKYRSRLHPRRENACASFCGRLSMWNRTAPDRRHLLPVATTKLIIRCD